MSAYTCYVCDRCGRNIQGKGKMTVYVSNDYTEGTYYHFCRECRDKFDFAMDLAIGRVRHDGKRLEVVEVAE